MHFWKFVLKIYSQINNEIGGIVAAGIEAEIAIKYRLPVAQIYAETLWRYFIAIGADSPATPEKLPIPTLRKTMQG